jgi:hypothetical protein
MKTMINDEQYKEAFKQDRIMDAFLLTVLKHTKNFSFLNLFEFYSCYESHVLKCFPQNMYLPSGHIMPLELTVQLAGM